MKGSFEDQSVINHSKFGVGYITKTSPDRIHVLFESEEKVLLQNRK